MKDKIILKDEDNSKVYLEKLLKKDGSSSKTYILKTTSQYIQKGENDGAITFIKPYDILIWINKPLEKAEAVVQSIDYSETFGYTVTFK